MYTVTIIHSSRLFRECLRHALAEAAINRVKDYASVDEWTSTDRVAQAGLVLVGLSGSAEADNRIVASVLDAAAGAHVVATGDCEDANLILDLLSKGVRGYIPSSLALDVTIGALQIVRAGGVYVPANCLLALPRQASHGVAKPSGFDIFTAKQVAVIDAIRKGKANKTIAYELNMCESTVKVHVRNIMKKMQARNRTQVAFIANKMMSERLS